MTIVEGQIGALRELKESLIGSGITRFNSIGDIRRFLKEFETEKNQLPSRIESELEAEIQGMQSTLVRHRHAYEARKTRIRNEIKQQISEIETEITLASQRSNRSTFHRVLYYFKISSLTRRASRLESNIESIIKKQTRSDAKSIAQLENEIEELLENKEKLSAERYKRALDDLTKTKVIVDGLYSFVAGAVGEASVVNALQQLSDDYYLINDYSLEFDPPIYNRKEDDRIYSIQIDHLLISPSGVFILETKNWSKTSIQNLDLRSPVKQILRTSFALFVLLNSDFQLNKIALERHHWGAKKIPIRNIVIMINEKPKEEFKHVKVLSLNELLGYIKYFDHSFDGLEVRYIFEYLKERM